MNREEQSIREANLRYPDSPERGYGTGDYDYGKPYLESRFDTLGEMIDDFDKTMGIE